MKKKKFLIINESDEQYIERLSHFCEIHQSELDSSPNLKQGINKAISQKWDLIFINFTKDIQKEIDFKRAITLFNGHHIPVILLYDEIIPSENSIQFTQQKSTLAEFSKGNDNDLLLKLISKTLSENNSVSIVRQKIIRSSTLEKPFIVKLLAGFLLLEPLIKIIYFWAITEFDLSRILNNVFHIDSFSEIFEFWLLYPLGGIALLSKWTWSFLIFMVVQLVIVFQNLTYDAYTWPYVASSPHVSSIILLLINLLIVIYFFSKKGRQHFINKQGFQLRKAERFPINFDCEVFYEEWASPFPTHIQNISNSGAYILCEKKIFLDDQIRISISINENIYHFHAQVMNRRSDGYGLRFVFKDLSDKKLLKKLIEQLRELNKSS